MTINRRTWCWLPAAAVGGDLSVVSQWWTLLAGNATEKMLTTWDFFLIVCQSRVLQNFSSCNMYISSPYGEYCLIGSLATSGLCVRRASDSVAAEIDWKNSASNSKFPTDAKRANCRRDVGSVVHEIARNIWQFSSKKKVECVSAGWWRHTEWMYHLFAMILVRSWCGGWCLSMHWSQTIAVLIAPVLCGRMKKVKRIN